MGTTWYLDINKLARRTPWAHRAMADFVQQLVSPVGGALLVLVLVLLVGWLSARRDVRMVPTVVWAGVGALVALGLDVLLAQVLAERRPYQVLSHVEVLVPRSSSYGAMPNSHAAVAGAVVCGLFLARRWWVGGLALVVALLLAFGLVYVGADYPSDAIAGIGFGAVVEVVLWPLGSWLLVPVVDSFAAGPLSLLVATRRVGPGAAPGPHRRKPGRPLPVNRGIGLPDARAMEALRAASEAARHAHTADPAPRPGGLGPVRLRGSDSGGGAPR